MTDIHEERELFRQALLEARLRKSQQIMDADTDEVQFSKKHLRKMQQIISADRSSLQFAFYSRKKKRILALLIAAAVLIIGSITVYANKDAIVQFVQKIFCDHIEVSYANQGNVEGIPEWIEQEYAPSYLPKGYELVETSSGVSYTYSKYQNAKGDYIQFDQRVIDSSLFVFDNEKSDSDVIQLTTFTVYCTHRSSGPSFYVWTDGRYAYQFVCSSNISQDELTQMIMGISETE